MSKRLETLSFRFSALFLISILFTGWAVSNPATAKAATTVNFVQANSFTNNTKSVSLAFGANTAAANMLIVGIDFSNAVNFSTISDTQGNAFTQIGTEILSPAGVKTRLYYAKSIKGGADTVTTSLSAAATYHELYIAEYSGADAANPLDSNVQNTGVAGTVNSGNLTTTGPNDTLIALCIGDSECTTSPGFIFRINHNSNKLEDKLTTSAGSYSVGGTSNAGWGVIMGAFKPAGGTPDTTPPSVPGNLSATSMSSSQINLNWTASTDNVAVAGYKVFRGGIQVGTTTAASFSDTGLSPSTTYSYTISAFDTSNNVSGQSSPAQATTQVFSAPLPTVTISASPTSIISGQFSTITWSSTNATTCTASNGWSGTMPTSGSQSVSPTATTTYTLLCSGSGGSASQSATVNVNVPIGFQQTVFVSGLNTPEALGFAPDGRLFVSEKGGTLRVIKNGVLLPTPFVTLTVDSSGERGLSGVEFDPNFAANHFVYVYYTATTPTIHNRVSRFTANGDVAVPGSEVVLIDLPTLNATNHNGGAIHFSPTDFGTDGKPKLYISVGDNADGANSQTTNTTLGKILRINNDGTIPTDNPFYASTTGINQAIWAMGLRNPFTFAFDSLTGRMLINDVGENTWEEIDLGVAGANYGWQICEGPQNTGVGSCNNPAFTYPLYVYNHNGSSAAITGAAIYRGNQFPPQFAGSYFFGDYILGFIDVMDTSNNVSSFQNADSPVNITVGPDGSLYYVSINSGDIDKISYNSGTTNPPPTVSISASPSSIGLGQFSTITWSSTNATTCTASNGWSGTMPTSGSQSVSPAVSSTYTLSCTGLGGSASQNTTVTVSDVTAPSAPTNLAATSTSSSQINLTWTASTDDVGVTGYKVFRGGAQVGTSTSVSFSDIGLSPVTLYSYTVSAFDAAGNVSLQSATSSATTLSVGSGPAYPLKASASGRYLVDQNNVPFLLKGDSPQSLFANISETDADAFLADRKAQGFNSVWINLLDGPDMGGRADDSTYDGIIPFTTPGDLSTPNPAYFNRVDDMMRLAQKYGLNVLLDPLETASGGGWEQVAVNNGVAVDRAYGQFLGNHFKGFDNIIWMSGNDFCDSSNPTSDAALQAIALGIKDVDTRHIQTTELCFEASGSLDDPSWAPIIGLDSAYTTYDTYAQVLNEYNRPNFMPVFRIESRYEFEGASPLLLRQQEYWTILSGGLSGQFYGNGYDWPFKTGWQSNIDTAGALQFNYANILFTSYPWYSLIPDQNHTVVTGGYGTFRGGAVDPNQSDYTTAARTADGSLVMAYMPGATTLNVDMSQLSSPAIARWYDPGNGTYVPINNGSPFTNSGSRQFTPPGTGFNSVGDSDWLLVLQTIGPDTVAPSVPTNLTATAISASQINLSWTASTDNVGVAGYQIFRDSVQIATGTAAMVFSDTGLGTGTFHTYTVSAFDSAGNISAVSSSASATTLVLDLIPPSVPTNLVATAVSSSKINLSWTASTDNVGVTGYDIFRNGAQVGTSTTASFSDAGLLPVTLYTYAVSAFDASNNVSGTSTSAQATTQAATGIDWGFDFRATSGFVTDGTNKTYVLGDVFPVTRNGEGPFGWTSGCSDCTRDRSKTIDVRLAGSNSVLNTGPQKTFKVTLPSAGTYTIHLALGDPTFGQVYQYAQLQDGNTAFATVDEQTGTDPSIRTFYDATGAIFSAANWPSGEKGVTHTFTTTTLNIVVGSPTSHANNSTIAHLRIVSGP